MVSPGQLEYPLQAHIDAVAESCVRQERQARDLLFLRPRYCVVRTSIVGHENSRWNVLIAQGLDAFLCQVQAVVREQKYRITAH